MIHTLEMFFIPIQISMIFHRSFEDTHRYGLQIGHFSPASIFQKKGEIFGAARKDSEVSPNEVTYEVRFGDVKRCGQNLLNDLYDVTAFLHFTN